LLSVLRLALVALQSDQCLTHTPGADEFVDLIIPVPCFARALEESGRAGEVVFIGHELTEHTRRFLLSGVMAVIDQSPRLEAREATHALAEAAWGRTVDKAALAIGMQVIFRENIPPR
jgi:ABC-type sugar transport system substrate-binding protein